MIPSAPIISYEVVAMDLLTPNRFDLLAKYIYANSLVLGVQSAWQKQLYINHIKTFNGLVEADGSGKHGENGFISSFDSIIASIGAVGFQTEFGVIPLCIDGTLLDGAHRTTVCIVLDRPVTCVRLNKNPCAYNYSWFRNKGLDEDSLDAMAFALCSLKKKTFVVVVFPAAQGRNAELVELIEKHSLIWYRKDIRIDGDGAVNLIRQVYRNEPWIGNHTNDFNGARNKAERCFQGPDNVRTFIVEANLEDILTLKIAIRSMYKVGNHSVHINDTQEETCELAKIFFNKNTVHFLNNSLPSGRKWFQKLFYYYKCWVFDNSAHRNALCIDGSSVLAVYGLREARDIDFLHSEDVPETGFKEISSHNHEANYYAFSIAEMISNPKMHFFVDGLKFLSLSIVRNMKIARAEEKDFEDIVLIDQVLENCNRDRLKKRQFGFLVKFMTLRNLRREVKFLALKARFAFYVLKNKIFQ